MRSQSASYHGYRFPPDIISHAVWLYHRFCLSFRGAEDLLAQGSRRARRRASASAMGGEMGRIRLCVSNSQFSR